MFPRRDFIKSTLASAFCLLSVGQSAEEDPTYIALYRLMNVEYFAFGGTGYAGVTSKGEIDFKIVLGQRPEDALKTFQKLYAEGNIQGKCYALEGIRLLRPDLAQNLYKKLLISKSKVATMEGCIYDRNNDLRGVVKHIQAGDYDIDARSKSVHRNQ